ncbi:ABC-type transport auxiliary lipoprotein family protein [Carboxylicivirga sp. RSCT41]|uniref:ABC-type transport auxiliary lipoprotein family protein n=1 Tax=Carboxylicivirga agarovorans TaxID=3417570 RepID=UPI003D33D653
MRRLIHFITTITLILFCACISQNKMVTKYYLIEKPPSIQYAKDTDTTCLNGFCEISPVQIYPAYGTQKIVNRSNRYEIVYYNYHQWAQLPGESFTLLLEDYFTQAPVFKGVSTRYWRLSPVYKLRTIIYKLEIVEQENHLLAHISLEFILSANTEDKTLITHRADKLQKLEKKDLNEYAKSIGVLFYQELNAFTEKIMKYALDNK